MPEMSMKEFNDKVQRWAVKFPQDAIAAMGEATREVHHEVVTKHLSGPKMAQGQGSKTNATLQQRSGDLLGSITDRILMSGRRIQGQVGTFKNRLVYAKIQEYGGTIYPKGDNKYLRFKINGKFVSVEKVVIPERSYLRSSLKAKRQKIKDIFLKAIKRSYTNA